MSPRLLRRENGRLLPTAEATVLGMTAATLLSKLLGILRSLVIASVFGTESEASAYFAAIRIPTTVFDLLLSAALITALPPMLGRLRQSTDKERQSFLDGYLSVILLAGGFLTLLLLLLAPFLVTVSAPGLTAEAKELAVFLTRLISPSLLFCITTYYLIACLRDKGKHLLPAFVSLFSNGILLLYLFLTPMLDSRMRVIGLAIAYSVSWLIQTLTLYLPHLSSLCLFPKNPLTAGTALRYFPFSLILPATLSAWLIPLSLLITGARASLLAIGGYAAFDYAASLFLLLAALLTSNLTAYLYPELSADASQINEFALTARRGLSALLALSLPIASYTLLMAPRIVCLLFLGGAFTPSDAQMTANLLRAFISALPFYSINEWLTRICLASSLTRPPRIAALLSIALVLLAAPLMPTLSLLGFLIPLSQLLTTAVLLCLLLTKRREIFHLPLLVSTLRTLLFTSVATLIFSIPLLLPLPTPEQAGRLGNLLILTLTFVPGALSYLLLSARFGIDSKQIS